MPVPSFTSGVLRQIVRNFPPILELFDKRPVGNAQPAAMKNRVQESGAGKLNRTSAECLFHGFFTMYLKCVGNTLIRFFPHGYDYLRINDIYYQRPEEFLCTFTL